MVLQSEWTIAHEVLKPILTHWETPLVDLFAIKFSRRLPLYVSPVQDPEAWAIDALAVPWKDFLGSAFPPLPHMGKVQKKAREENASLILVAPFWPAQPWFLEILSLSHLPPLCPFTLRNMLVGNLNQVLHT